MKWARLENDVVIEIFNFNPNEWIKNDDFLKKCELIPDNVEQNWAKRGEKWVSPEEISKEVELNKEIELLKQKLVDTDYQAIKFAEGQLTADEYKEIKELRQAWRDEINKLEEELKNVD